MLDALDTLKESGTASPRAILIPTTSEMASLPLSSTAKAKQFLAGAYGQRPSDVSTVPGFIASSFAEQHDGPRDMPEWLRDAEAARPTPGDQLNMGLPAAATARLRDLESQPRLCFMASGGMRTFTIGDLQLPRPVSPYELQFDLMHSQISGRRSGFFGEQSPLGVACHVTSPEVPLGTDHFACVAADLTLSETQLAVRADSPTLLEAEQLAYTLMTLDPISLNVSFGFSPGPGGDAESTRAMLAGIRFQKGAAEVAFSHRLPGSLVVERINLARSHVLRALASSRSRAVQGQEVLLWEDASARAAMEALVELVESARERPVHPELAVAPPVLWISLKQRRAAGRQKGGEAASKPGEDQDVLDMQTLQPIELPTGVEKQLAIQAGGRSGGITHRFECPDCGERFQDWESCQEHYEMTCHLDVSTEQGRASAQELSQPVTHRCLECGAAFFDWASCKAHLAEWGHLDWAGEEVARLLCVPRPMDGAEDDMQDAPSAPPDELSRGRMDVRDSHSASNSAGCQPAPAAQKETPPTADVAPIASAIDLQSAKRRLRELLRSRSDGAEKSQVEYVTTGPDGGSFTSVLRITGSGQDARSASWRASNSSKIGAERLAAHLAVLALTESSGTERA